MREFGENPKRAGTVCERDRQRAAQRRWTKVRHWETEKVGGTAGAFAPYHESGDLLCMTAETHLRQRMCLVALRKNGRGGPEGLPRPLLYFQPVGEGSRGMGKEQIHMKKRLASWLLALVLLAQLAVLALERRVLI